MKMKKMPIVVAFACCAFSLFAGEQLMNLPAAPKGGRFKVPADRVWPAEPGQTDICLWADDRFAACAITIDDNWLPEHEWWLKITEELGIKVTWFMITDGVVKSGKRKGTFPGCWEEWQRIADAGHSIQSHTTDHCANTKNTPPEKRLTNEKLEHMYRDSLAVINENITNNLACCIAYPCGDGHADVASRFAIGARGVYGVPSTANGINYMDTSIGGAIKCAVEMVAFGESKEPPAWMAGMKHLRRGINIPLFHSACNGKDAEAKAAHIKQSEDFLRYVASLKEDRLWVCRFDDAMRYGQERDTATLTVKENTAKGISYELTDRMNDELFNFPLTIKIRLPQGVKSVAARQNGKSVEAKVIEHDGAGYALVKSVPDRGLTVVDFK